MESSASNALSFWQRYQPSDNEPWNLQRAHHLHRRAGFAATWTELQRDLRSGPGLSIDRILNQHLRKVDAKGSFEARVRHVGRTASGPRRLQAWWLLRMLEGPDPLIERLTLLWHNHFATSMAKVPLPLMRRQNEIFREHATGRFGKLLADVLRDPAVLLWLDAPANLKEHPNENLARELLELFTLGVDQFTERDVKETARALTGWTVVDNEFSFDRRLHDSGPKEIFGQKREFTADDVIRRLVRHPMTARRLAYRLCLALFGEGAVPSVAMEQFAQQLNEHDLDIRWGVETILRSRGFFAEANIGTRVQSPVEYVVGCVRKLELLDPAPSTVLLAEQAAEMGQELFFPPNVGGWSGGRHWITTRWMISRTNYAWALVRGELWPRRRTWNPLALPKRSGCAEGVGPSIEFYFKLIHGASPKPAEINEISEAAQTNNSAETVRNAVAHMLASPRGQLG